MNNVTATELRREIRHAKAILGQGGLTITHADGTTTKATDARMLDGALQIRTEDKRWIGYQQGDTFMSQLNKKPEGVDF